MSEKKYKLKYFDIMGFAEPVRLLFAHAKIPYIDERLQEEGWDDKQRDALPWAKMPILEDGNFVLSQSLAILRYVAEKHGYMPDGLEDRAKADEYVNAMNDFREADWKKFFEDDPKKKEELVNSFKEKTAPFYLARLNDILKEKGQYLIGNKLSYADFCVAHFVQMSAVEIPGILDNFEYVKKHQELVFELPGIKEWVAVRPKTYV